MKKLFLSLAMALAGILPAASQEFFSTDEPAQLFNLGGRVGLNTSNRTITGMTASVWNHNSWGVGFDAGFVADINLKNFISLQPGFFYETRSGAFAYQNTLYAGEVHTTKTQVGKGREYLFTVPIVASFHFNITDELRWNVDAGPYMQFKLKSTFDKKFQYPLATATGGIEYFDDPKTARFDIGLKLGTGLDIFKDYYIGVHYLAGFCHAWNPGKLGGHNKAWMFTIGYTFF